jgi:hypothetical protein
VYAPEEVAKAILHAATHPVRDIYVGGGGKLMSTTNKYAPGAMDWLEAKTGVAQQKQEGTRAVDPAGSLHRPNAPHAKVRGSNPGHVMETSLYTRATLHPVLAGVAAATGLAAAIALVASRSRTALKDAGVPQPGEHEPRVPATDN